MKLREKERNKSPTVGIIGGGISGCTAAMALHKKNIKALWFQKRSQPSYPWPETIQKEALESLYDLGVPHDAIKSTFQPIDHHFSCWGSDKLLIKKQCHIYNQNHKQTLVNKQEFLKQILDHATINNQQILKIVKHLNIVESKYKITFVDNSFSYVDILIDASGTQSLSKYLIDQNQINHGNCYCYHWILDQPCASNKLKITDTFIEESFDGWWYAAPTHNQQLSLLHASYTPLKQHQRTTGSNFLKESINKTIHLKDWIRKINTRIFSKPFIFMVSIQSCKIFAQAFKSSFPMAYFIVGDSAITHDPLSSFGTSSGIWSALKMAECLETYLNDQDTSSIDKYNIAMKEMLEHTLTERQLLLNKKHK